MGVSVGVGVGSEPWVPLLQQPCLTDGSSSLLPQRSEILAQDLLLPSFSCILGLLISDVCT